MYDSICSYSPTLHGRKVIWYAALLYHMRTNNLNENSPLFTSQVKFVNTFILDPREVSNTYLICHYLNKYELIISMTYVGVYMCKTYLFFY